MNNISKIVLLSNDGKKFGYILDVALNGLDRVGYYIVDEESEEEFFVRDEDIVIGKDSMYAFVSDNLKLDFVSDRPENLRGRIVMDECCNFYGNIEEIRFNKKKCQKIVTNMCEILPKYVKKIGEDAVIISLKRKKKVRKEQSFPRGESDVVVTVQSDGGAFQPEKVLLSSSFYVGKISKEDVFGYNNEKIVLKGETITKSVFEKAKTHNKLNHLFFSLKR